MLRVTQSNYELQNVHVVPNFSANKVHNFEVQTLQSTAFFQLKNRFEPWTVF